MIGFQDAALSLGWWLTPFDVLAAQAGPRLCVPAPLLGVEGDGGGPRDDALVVGVQPEVHGQPAQGPARIRPDWVPGLNGVQGLEPVAADEQWGCGVQGELLGAGRFA